jgi:hypothetical protein
MRGDWIGRGCVGWGGPTNVGPFLFEDGDDRDLGERDAEDEAGG